MVRTAKTFTVDFGASRTFTEIADSVSGDSDYTAKLEVVAP